MRVQVTQLQMGSVSTHESSDWGTIDDAARSMCGLTAEEAREQFALRFEEVPNASEEANQKGAGGGEAGPVAPEATKGPHSTSTPAKAEAVALDGSDSQIPDAEAAPTPRRKKPRA